MDNVLRSYCGTQYRYDERGNLLERIENGKAGKFTWDLYDRLRRYEDDRLVVEFGYDALGRRVYKDSRSKYRNRVQAGPVWNENARRALDEQLGCNLTLFIWDGDTLAFEQRGRDGKGQTTHYVFEPGTFVPVAQGVMNHIEEMLRQPNYHFPYDIDRDPVWQHKPTPKPFDALVWYQCDHLGIPMEVTDANAKIAWTAIYEAWGTAKENGNKQADLSGMHYPLRFQGQYFDPEAVLHYSRYRYYDPFQGRFITRDPIGLYGDINSYTYAPNPIEWTDPLGLSRTGRTPPPTGKKNIDNRTCCAEKWIIQRYDKRCSGHVPGVGNVSLYRDPKDGNWYSPDKTEHGSSWKVFTESRNSTLEWLADLNEHGDMLTGKKHKGPTGRQIDLKSLKCQEKK
ncbi:MULTISPECIES: RHS repeat-associated core domain-containing protein [unclassified Pseudomonas]|nr:MULTISPECIES: RHS repeat-associated core domain-containing protein [unclassified Pseudomonas]SMF32954.1 RHS repeat-associated core domain-containing protein [Pseudomonas sp. LAIL14HWK12:I11]SMR77957.1 RHS repeat-associated core domain-containing protein [Pseudomonas sp. LAIL14HWK12:I10]SOD04240.1 RHS repeat-associated core domain-containing protein [Pseudomonas sp. LAIL14HWK12:I8]